MQHLEFCFYSRIQAAGEPKVQAAIFDMKIALL